ncbi:hypothetical protein BKA66DRAFT_562431 [Pyrenochaeta sp. MPI-SDFR-AT-0127]|nr:hypothetical protein BKA66DRAFT_562431 [Pyrenochaeta sp. MPI-SDFR-AT-0127]
MPDQLTCDQCGSCFQRREHYQRHLRTHTQEKPFACSVCGNSFGRIDSLARHHSSTHTDATTQMAMLKPGERQRVSRACKRCSTSKIRCDGLCPCEKCTLAGAECFYEPPKRRRAALQHTTEPELESQPQPKRRVSQLSTSQNDNESIFIDPAQILQMPSVGNDASQEIMDVDIFGAPRIYAYNNELGGVDWMSENLDMNFWPATFDLQQETQLFQSISRTEIPTSQILAEPPRAPIHHLPPTPASDIAELFSRSHTPVLDSDAVDMRQYHPTSIELDAPLSFQEIDLLSLSQVDMEDFAHVEGLSSEKEDAINRLLDEVQSQSHYPLFKNPKIPPRPVLNAWIQLYFEYFHPVFPVLHKASFSSPETHPLLVLAVAAIGAQFSNLKNSFACALSLHELVRRQASRHCEFQNKHGRTVWMTQVVMLNSLGMSYSGERRALEVAEILQAVPVALARRKGLLNDVMAHERISQLAVPLEQTWRLWVMDEERRRTGFCVWLVDAGFRANFNLTAVLDSCELKNSLPQAEHRWNAMNCQSWASFPPGLGSGRTKTLGDIFASSNWISIWSQTGTIGKQVILEELMETVRPKDHFHYQTNPSSTDTVQAEKALESLLVVMEAEHDMPVIDLKALIAQKAICLAALMLCHVPVKDTTTAALSRIYNRCNDRELSEIGEAWRATPYQGRKMVLHAGRLFQTIRTNHTTHYSVPIYLLRATLTLWLYSLLLEKPDVTGYIREQDTLASITLGTADINSSEVGDWISNGRGRVKLPGIANLLCKQGRQKLLRESMVAMALLKSWGISKAFLHLLRRLEASETTSETC